MIDRRNAQRSKITCFVGGKVTHKRLLSISQKAIPMDCVEMCLLVSEQERHNLQQQKWESHSILGNMFLPS